MRFERFEVIKLQISNNYLQKKLKGNIELNEILKKKNKNYLICKISLK